MGWIEQYNKQLSITRQCELLDFPRASYYYTPQSESPLNLKLMELIDKQYLKTPFYGARKMLIHTQKEGYAVNIKRIRRLMHKMGIEALYPKPRLSQPNHEHKIYPYLLRDLKITKPNQAWCSDITYIPMPNGFMYLVVVMDWYSRYVLAWALSNSLNTTFCLEALNDALRINKPEIFNTDQGSQFTANEFTSQLLKAEINISMDGRGRALDNIFVERLWRSVKYEDIYLKSYEDGALLWCGVHDYFQFYNYERPHQSLGYATPAETYGIGELFTKSMCN